MLEEGFLSEKCKLSFCIVKTNVSSKKLQVNLLATLTDSWMLLDDFEALRGAYMGVDFFSPYSDSDAALLWRPVVDRFLQIEVKDTLERINFYTPFFEPLCMKKTRIFKSESLPSTFLIPF